MSFSYTSYLSKFTCEQQEHQVSTNCRDIQAPLGPLLLLSVVIGSQPRNKLDGYGVAKGVLTKKCYMLSSSVPPQCFKCP